MSTLRPLRGGCACGRNHYTINLPENPASLARVLFETDPQHRIFQGSPLSAFLRVPLSWYHSSTSAFFPDEVNGAIRRTYTHKSSKRGFCGFCGTPLSYWSEDPPSEADFIRLTLGSLSSEDLGDLEELGLIPGSEDEEEAEAHAKDRGGRTHLSVGSSAAGEQTLHANDGNHKAVARETLAVPWFDSLMAGSKLGKVGHMRTSRASGQSRDGGVRYEWEVVEWTTEDGDGSSDSGGGQPSPSKRLKQSDDEGGVEGVTSSQRR